MLRPRWKKIISDLLSNKARTALAVLSIAVGVFAVGMIINTYLLLVDGITTNYYPTKPFSAIIVVSSFDDDLIQTVESMPEVLDAEGRRGQNMRIKINDRWFRLYLSALNYDKHNVSLLEPTMGDYPPADRQILIDQSAFALTEVEIGNVAVVENPAGDLYNMPVVGLVRDMNANPSVNSNGINGYTTLSSFEWLGESEDYNRLYFIAADNQTDMEYIQVLTGKVRDKIEGCGYQVHASVILPEPGKNPMNFILDGIRIVLGTLAAVSLFLSAFLVYNTVSALLLGQIQQIGIMKSIGASYKDLLVMYIILVGVFGILSFALASPLAAIAANQLANFIASPEQTDIKLPPFYVPVPVLLLEVVVSLAVPVFAAIPVIVKNVKTTVQEALLSYGLGETGVKPTAGRLVNTYFRSVSVIWILSLNNMMRKKTRVILTLSTLILGGSVFIGVFTVRDSSNLTVNELGDAYNFDVQVSFERPYRIIRLEEEALRIPGVINAEGWAEVNGVLLNENGQEGNNITLFGLPAESSSMQPKLISGRWLLPEDDNGLVVGTDILREYPDLKVGDNFQIKVNGTDYYWKIVGLYRVIGAYTQYEAYSNYPYLTEISHDVGVTSKLQLETLYHDRDFQKQVAELADEHYAKIGLRVSDVETSSGLKGVLNNQFDTIVKVDLVMAILIIVVGGLGLAGTMSMNVMDRTREIGVMRAIGASDHSILRIVMLEGVLIAIVSWLFSLLLAVPVGLALSNSIGINMMNGPLSFSYSYAGALYWLVIVVVIALFASYWPARYASKLTVHDVLAYE